MIPYNYNAADRGSPVNECLAIHDLLPPYVTAIVLSEYPPSSSPDLVHHLQHCANCSQAFRELLELTLAAFTGQIEPASHYPQVDLGFLHPSSHVLAVNGPTFTGPHHNGSLCPPPGPRKRF